LGSKTESRLSAGPLAVLTLAVLTSFAHCFTLFIIVLCNVQLVGWTFFETHLKTTMINMEKNSIETMDFSDSYKNGIYFKRTYVNSNQQCDESC